ncbi:MAG: N-acetylmuramoyl-L-alanine amidase family protein, partial [Lawsonibacter sp.]
LLSGYDCQTMRVDDVTGEMDISLKSRCSQANKANADVYVSIHHNAGIHGGSGGGIVVYINPSHQKQSEVMQQAAYRHLIARTGLKGNRSSPLAQANHQVTRETTMPAILCECGFMDSATDTPLILTEEFSQQAAQGLCDALVEVYGLQWVPCGEAPFPDGANPQPEDEEYTKWKRHMERYLEERRSALASDWAEEGIQKAVSMGITSPIGYGMMDRPRDFTTREETALMCVKAVEAAGKED